MTIKKYNNLDIHRLNKFNKILTLTSTIFNTLMIMKKGKVLMKSKFKDWS